MFIRKVSVSSQLIDRVRSWWSDIKESSKLIGSDWRSEIN